MEQPISYALIPARGGSKGVPRKNIRMVAGKPLIVWTIEAAQQCPDIQKVYVSTDDEEIQTVARAAGAEIIERPRELAQDTTPAAPVLAHFMGELKKNGPLPDYVAYLQPTSPLRTAVHLTEAFAQLHARGGDSVVSVTKGEAQWLKAFVGDEAFIRPLDERFTNVNRQALPPVYEQNGVLYILPARDLMEHPRFFGERTVPYVMSPEDSLDIDTEDDLARAEKILTERHG